MKQQNTQFKILSKGHVGLFSSMVLCATMSFAAPVSTALPSLNNVASGTVGINTTGATMNIDQASQKSVINWNSYNIGSSATVNYNFAQSGSSSLNRVMSNNPSEIYGRLNANGQVILMNPNGVIFGNGSAINVGGLVATTMNMKDTDYLNGKMIFTRDNATGAITNNATLTAQEKGFIALLSPTVVNNGVIRATMGSVSLAGGDKIELSLDNTGLKTIIVEPSTIKTLIENKSLVEANGGMIYMGAKEAQVLLDGAMNIKNSGSLEATKLSMVDGKIILDGNGIEFDGSAKATEIFVGNIGVEKTVIKGSATLEGEFVETSAKNLRVEDGVNINTKTWLLDPTNITIASGGTEPISGTPATTSTAGDVTISGVTIQNELNSGTSVLLEATNNITVNDTIDKYSYPAATLTLKAGNDILINAGKNINGHTGPLNLVLWADSDGSGAGKIQIGSAAGGSPNTTISLNGGNLAMSGGATAGVWEGLDVGTSYAIGSGSGAGVTAYQTYINAKNVLLKGSGTTIGVDMGTGVANGVTAGITTTNTGHLSVLTGSGGFYMGGELHITGATSMYVHGSVTAKNNANTFGVEVLANTTGDIYIYSATALNLGDIVTTCSDGLIDIRTMTGDINVNGEISAVNSNVGLLTAGIFPVSNAYRGAINLIAGQNAPVLTTTGGDIKLNGGVIYAGANAKITLYTGSIAGSTDLATYVGTVTPSNPAGERFRYSSDVDWAIVNGWDVYTITKNYTTDLIAGKNVIYRERPFVTITPTAYTSTEGTVFSHPGTFTLVSGTLYNGDTVQGNTNSIITSTGQTNSSAGTYNINVLMQSYNKLGYGLTSNPLVGGHTITAVGGGSTPSTSSDTQSIAIKTAEKIADSATKLSDHGQKEVAKDVKELRQLRETTSSQSRVASKVQVLSEGSTNGQSDTKGGGLSSDNGKSSLTSSMLSVANPFGSNESVSILEGGVKVAALDLPQSTKTDIPTSSGMVETKEQKQTAQTKEEGVKTESVKKDDKQEVKKASASNKASETKEDDKKQKSVVVTTVSDNVMVAKVNPQTGNTFSFTVKDVVTAKVETKEVKNVSATTATGQALPSWLKFDKTTQTFVATNPPSGALPLATTVTATSTNGQVVKMNVEITK